MRAVPSAICALVLLFSEGCAPPNNPASEPDASMKQQSNDVCGFDDPVSLGPVASDGLVDVPPNHPALFYLGRVDCSNPLAPTFAYPGVSIRARFEGDALDLHLEDFGRGGPQDTNYYEVLIDGQARTLEVRAGVQTYQLARELGPGPHDLEIFKRVESNHGAGKARFLGLRVRSESELLPVAARPRRLEFIGDSITCGYGNEVSTNDPNSFHYTTKNSNAYQAYGAIAARELGAEYLAVAASGRGVTRNYADEPGTLVPELHALILPDEGGGPRWDYARYQPDVTIINLGANDYSTPGVDRARFRARYAEFLAELRRHYPKTKLLVAVGPTLNDEIGNRKWSNIRQDLRAAIEARRKAGERNIDYLEFTPQSAPFGEDWHPTRATHTAMARVLIAKLRSLMGW